MVLPTFTPSAPSGPLTLTGGFLAASSSVPETEGLFSIAFTLDQPSDREVTFDVIVTDVGTLTQDVHYRFVGPPSVTIPEGGISGSLQMETINDPSTHATRTVTLGATTEDPSVVLDVSSHVLSITDTTIAPTVDFNTSGVTLEQGSNSSSGIQIVVTDSVPEEVSVGVLQTGGSLIQSKDFEFPDSVVLDPNQKVFDFLVSTVPTGVAGTATLELQAPKGGAVGKMGTLEVEVTEASELPIVRWTATSRTNSILETEQVTLTAELVGATAGDVTAALVLNEAATSAQPADYTVVPGPGNFTLTDAVRTKEFVVTATADGDDDDGETVGLQLNVNTLEGQVEPSTRQSFITIGNVPPGVDPEIPPVSVSSPSSQAMVQGGTAPFTVSRPESYPGETVVVEIDPAPGGTAVLDTHYSLSATVLTFGPNDLSKTATVTSLANDASRDVVLEIIRHERVSNGAADGLIESPSSANYQFLQLAASFGSDEVEMDAGTTSTDLTVTIPSALASPYTVTLALGNGPAVLDPPVDVTIPAGMTSAPVSLVSPTASGQLGQEGRFVHISSPSTGINKALVKVDAVRQLEAPAFEMLCHYAYAVQGQNVWGAVKCTNFGLADFSSSVTLSLGVDDGILSTGSVLFDGSKEVIAFKVQPTVSDGAFDVLLTGAGVSAQNRFKGLDGSMVGKTGQLRRSPVPGLSGPQLVHFVTPMLKPVASAPDLSIAGVGLSTSPWTYDHETGHPATYVTTGLVETPGESIPKLAGALTVSGSAGSAPAGTLQELDMSSLELQITIANADEVFSCEPFQAVANPSIVKDEVVIDTPAYRLQVVTMEVIASLDSAACSYVKVFRHTRADMACEMLDIVQVHGKFDKTEDPSLQSSNGFGELAFKKIELVNIPGALDAVVFDERPARPERTTGVQATNNDGSPKVDGSGDPIWTNGNAPHPEQEAQFFYDSDNNKVVLSNEVIGSGPDDVQHMPTGGVMPRMIAIYDPATVTEAQAQFVVERRDRAMLCSGEIGFQKGGWLGYQVYPDFFNDSLSSSIDGQSKHAAFELLGQSEVSKYRGQLQNSQLDVGGDSNRSSTIYAGWMKGTFTQDSRTPGQAFMSLHGYLGPSPSMNHRTLGVSNLWLERYGAGMLEASSYEPVTLDDITAFTSGTLPCEFSPNYAPDEHRHPHCLDGPSGFPGQTPSSSTYLAASGNRWNALEVGQTQSNRYFTEYVGRGIYRQWAGMHMGTHMSRYLSQWAGAVYMLACPVAKMAMEFDGPLKACQVQHLAVNPNRPQSINRYEATVGSEQSFRQVIDLGYLDTFSKGRGTWRKPLRGAIDAADVTYSAPASTRQFMHPVAMVMFYLGLMPKTDPRVAIFDKAGSRSLSFHGVISQVYSHAVSGNGNGFPSFNLNERHGYSLETPDYDELTGYVPGRDQDNTPGWYTSASGIHEVYCSWAFAQVDKRLREYADYDFPLQRWASRAEIVEDCCTAKVAGAQTPFEAYSHVTAGTEGPTNPIMHEIEAKREIGYWRGRVPPRYPFGTSNDIAAWCAGALVGFRWSMLGRTDKMKLFVERQTGDQSGKSLDMVIEDYWSEIKSRAYTVTSTRADFWSQALPGLGALQLSKTLP